MVDLEHPNYKIPLAPLQRPYKLVSEFKKNRLQNYCYAFWVKENRSNTNILMNIGMSDGGRIGDRIYRKVGNLDGWGSHALTGVFGSDMKKVVELVEEKFEHLALKIHKNDVCLHIWDTTKLTSTTYKSPTIDAEKKLFRDCKEKFGCIPAGNIQDPNDRNKQSTSKVIFENLFIAD